MPHVTTNWTAGRICYGQRVIEYTCLHMERKTLEIAVHPDASVVVKAPHTADRHQIEAKLRKRVRWIVKQQNFFNQFTPRTPQRHYLGGETHLYLGKHYQLKIAVGTENSIQLKRGVFEMTCSSKVTPPLTKRLLQSWYAEKATTQFKESLDRCWPPFGAMGHRRPSLSIRPLQKRWGSLSELATLTLNTELVKAPKECIDYVVTHELCHLEHYDHSPTFYRLLETILPEWRQLKHKLELRMA